MLLPSKSNLNLQVKNRYLITQTSYKYLTDSSVWHQLINSHQSDVPIQKVIQNNKKEFAPLYNRNLQYAVR
jgi:hypothetical protein